MTEFDGPAGHAHPMPESPDLADSKERLTEALSWHWGAAICTGELCMCGRAERLVDLRRLVEEIGKLGAEHDWPWRPRSGAEDTCQRCGRDNPVWFVASSLWNATVREHEEDVGQEPMLCPSCFIFLAEKFDVARPTAWEVGPESIPVSTELLALRAQSESYRAALKNIRKEVVHVEIHLEAWPHHPLDKGCRDAVARAREFARAALDQETES